MAPPFRLPGGHMVERQQRLRERAWKDLGGNQQREWPLDHSH